MNEEEVANHCLLITTASNGVVLEVCVITWRHQHTPESIWMPIRGWLGTPSEIEIESTRRAVLRNPLYFRVCSMCNEHFPAGHMHDDRICCGCAEEHLGIIY